MKDSKWKTVTYIELLRIIAAVVILIGTVIVFIASITLIWLLKKVPYVN